MRRCRLTVERVLLLVFLVLMPLRAPYAQVTTLDTWIDTDFDGLPSNSPRTLNVGAVDSFAIYVDLTGFPTATWTNFLYAFALGPGPDSSTNYFANDTASVHARYDASGSIFPDNNFTSPYVYGLGGSGFNEPVVNGPYRLAVVQIRPIRPSTVGGACIVPQIITSNPAYLFCQFGNAQAYGLFDTGTVTPGCYTIQTGELVSITVQPADTTIGDGASLQFTAIGTYDNAVTVNVTGDVAWSSDNPAIAAITSTGLATGQSQGTTTVRATLGDIEGSTSLSVGPPTLVALSVEPTNIAVPRGTQVQYTATGTYTDGSSQDLTTMVAWSSSNPAVAQINAMGSAMALGEGSTVISASQGTIVGGTNLTVLAPQLVSVTIAPENPTIPEGFTNQFILTGTYADGSTQDLTPFAIWTSSNAWIASIGPSGFAIALDEGATAIRAVYGALSDETVLTVTPPVLVGMVVSPASAVLPEGVSKLFTATGEYSDGSTQDFTYSAAWTSANPDVVTMNPNGIAVAIAPGSTSISATVSGVSGDAAIEVIEALRVVSPKGGARWFVGATDSIRWSGPYSVTVALSLDGGYNYQTLRSNAPPPFFGLQVPHVPTRYGKARLSTTFDGIDYSAESDSFFVIESVIVLESFEIIASDARSARLQWKTQPTPPLIKGYRIEKAAGAGQPFLALHGELLTSGGYVDNAPGAASRYRLIAVNGFDEEFVLGEAMYSSVLDADETLAIYPNPAVEGRTSVTFRTPFDAIRGATEVPTHIAVYDVSGREVRTLANRPFITGVHSITWDGLDSNGRSVAPGAYFLRVHSGGAPVATERIVVVR